MNSNNHSERGHALLSASGSHRWMECPASALFSTDFPPQLTSKFAEEGTRAHELAERILQAYMAAIQSETIAYIEDVASSFNAEYSEEMVKHVLVYVNHVLSAGVNGSELSIEVSKDLKWLHAELKKGTADAVIKTPLVGIEVVDLKYGAGVPVSPFENTQLMMYAIMAAYDEEIGRIDETFEEVTLTIVQPRCGDEHVRSWTFPIEHLIEFSIALQMAAELAMDKDTPFSSGDHCRWCPCAHACPELNKVTKEVISAEFDIIPQITKLTDSEIAKILEKKSVIEGFIKSCEEYAMGKLLIGENIPGLKLVRGRGSRDWAKSEEEVEKELLELATPEDIYESGLKSVSKIEKVVGKKAIAHLIKSCEGKPTIAMESDKREKITVVSKDDFEMVDNNNLLE